MIKYHIIIFGWQGTGMHRLYELSKNNMFLNRHVKLDGTVHYHEAMKLVYVRSGTMNVSIGETEYKLSADTLLIVYPKQIHRFLSDDAPEDDSIMFLFDPSILPELSDTFATSVPKSACSRDIPFNKSLLHVLELISEPMMTGNNAEAEKYDCIAAKGGLLIVIQLLNRKLELVPLESTDDVMFKMLEYCNANYSGKITLENMENSMHLNACYISTLFMRRLGMGFHDYINSLRITDACKLLTTTDLGIVVIAKSVGFGTSRTFNRVFIDNFGMTPREYRKKFSLK